MTAIKHHIVRQPHDNLYYLSGWPIKEIIFFDHKTESEVFRTNGGWFSVRKYGSNNCGIKEIEELPFLSKRKVNLALNTNFFLRDTMYVNIHELEAFEVLGEQVDREGELETYYRNFIQFKCTMRDEKEATVQRLGTSRYTRSVPTAKGERVNALKELFGDLGIQVKSSYDIKTMVNNADEIKKLL